MPDKTVVLIDRPGAEVYNLAMLNQAMDAIMAAGTQEAGRYALVYTHGWKASDAVTYTNAAQICFDSSIDPNQLPDQTNQPVTPGHPPSCGCGECESRRAAQDNRGQREDREG